ncbi:hypothetical protein HY639_01810 [Candidatus Woesearchaeota archaeon]|nr:hypothetical protein [Candidatus Woesearchaeota archaeon]
MPHQCVRCSTLYDDGAKEILAGCTCGGRLFFYIKKSALEKAKQLLPPTLSVEEKQKIEKDIYEIIGQDPEEENPIVLDLESINVLQEGKFELDLVNLFSKEKPLVYKLEEGKYVIDLTSSFDKLRKE